MEWLVFHIVTYMKLLPVTKTLRNRILSLFKSVPHQPVFPNLSPNDTTRHTFYPKPYANELKKFFYLLKSVLICIRI